MAERGRPRTFDRTQALRKAMELFWSKGYEGTSLADLTAAMGINSPSLYAAFGCKEALFREAVQLYNETDGVATCLALTNAPTAREGILAMLLAAAESCTLADRPAGCLIVLSAPAGSDEHADVRKFLRHSRQEMQARIHNRLAQGIEEGEIAADADVKSLAAFYTTVLHGMAIQARDGATRRALQSVARHAMSALDACVAKRRPAAAQARSRPPRQV